MSPARRPIMRHLPPESRTMSPSSDASSMVRSAACKKIKSESSDISGMLLDWCLCACLEAFLVARLLERRFGGDLAGADESLEGHVHRLHALRLPRLHEARDLDRLVLATHRPHPRL